jgi:DNA anti-recombination protein RmuC
METNNKITTMEKMLQVLVREVRKNDASLSRIDDNLKKIGKNIEVIAETISSIIAVVDRMDNRLIRVEANQISDKENFRLSGNRVVSLEKHG